MRTHHHTIPVLVSACGAETEITADVAYTITPGSPAVGPTYASGGEPATPPEIEIDTVEITVADQKVLGGHITIPTPDWLVTFLANSDAVFEALGEAADWGENRPDPDHLYDQMRDDRMMGFDICGYRDD